MSRADEIIDYHERRILLFLDGGPDPRGPDITTPYQATSWLTKPLWHEGRFLHRLGRALDALGMSTQSARARQIVSDLQGRAQSPKELVAMIEFIEAP